MLTNSLKISVTTKTEFIELKFFHSDQKICQNYCRAEYNCYETHHFFQNVQNLMQLSDMQTESEKVFLVLEIIAFELIMISTNRERTLVIGSQYVKKESQDFRYY